MPALPAPGLGEWAILQTSTTSYASPAVLPITGWLPAQPVPVAAALPAPEGGWTTAALDEGEFWYRVTLFSDAAGILRCDGLATIAEVWLDGRCLLQSYSMFVRHSLRVPAATGDRRIVYFCFRSTQAAMRGAKLRRARWRPRLASPQGLRAVRTSLLGRMPGWCPPVPCVGLWREVSWLDAARGLPPKLLHSELRVGVDGLDGSVSADFQFANALLPDAVLELTVAGYSTRLLLTEADRATGTLIVPRPALWWPHTHGTPHMHDASLRIDDTVLALDSIGFRTVAADLGTDGNGFRIRVNDVDVFCRGACWTSAGLAHMPWTKAALRPWLELARDAGMNMLRVGGTMAYEADGFFELCDELGIMVWQDLMLANFDYPETDPGFLASLTEEIEQLLRRTAGRACFTVLCGGSEVMQQAAMLGLPPDIWRLPLYEDVIPAIARRLSPSLVYVANSPSGGGWPFTTDIGVTHYYGVGAYRRPFDDVRRAGVRFASECLGLANVPCAETVERHLPGVTTNDPRWKAATPRDPGASWDFEDVRDHYLKLLFAVDPVGLRVTDLERYLDLSRAVSCLVMEQVFAEWRRAGSTCAGGIVWQLQDLSPGAGWGVIDSDRRPKPAWHALRRAFRPRQIVITDEGLNGLTLHVVNENADPLDATVRLVCLRDGEIPIRAAEQRLVIAARATRCLTTRDMLRDFFDITGAYNFGPRTHDIVSASLWSREADGTAVQLATDHHMLAWSPPVRDLGLSAQAIKLGSGWAVRLTTRTFAQFCHFSVPDFSADEDWFHLPPVTERVVLLRQRIGVDHPPHGDVLALNLLGSVRIELAP